MIFPSRIRGCRNHVLVLRFALLFAACFLAPVGEAMAQYAAGSTSEAGAAGGGRFTSEAGAAGGGRHVPLEITAGVDLGYDDHVLSSNATTGASGQGSLSVRENLVLTYDRTIEPTEIRLIGVGSFTQFVSAGTNDKDVSLTLGFTTHFALVGFDHSLTEHLQINVLGGASFRSFKDDGNSIDPYAEVGIHYQGSNHSLIWVTTYSVEQPTQTLAMGTTTFRTGLNATYHLTSRLNARAAVYYYNSG